MRLSLAEAGAGISPRRASHFLLLRQKKVTKEKATPLSATPSLRSGATCGARVSRGLAELASLRQLRALIRETLRSSAQPEGVGRAFASLGLAMLVGPSLRSALCLSCPLSLWERVRVRAPGLTNVAMVSIARSPHPSPLPEGEGGNTNAERSDGLLGTRGRAKQRPESPPSGCAEERRGKRDKGRSSLSGTKCSEFCGPPLSPSTAGLPAAKRRDTDSGVAFFCLLFLARQEK